MTITDLRYRLKDAITVCDSSVFSHYSKYLPGDCIVLGGGEGIKTLDSAQQIIDELLKRGASRHSVLAAVGGGSIGDTVGFVASIFMRGISYINVPTTLTAFVDSSIGGKTALNFGTHKNLIGSFYSPTEVIYCYEFLDTLNKALIDDGYGEIIKAALLDKGVYDSLESNDLRQIIEQCIRFKQELVACDFTDRGVRQCLNMGHTLAHSIELNYGVSHGKAVALGLRLEHRLFDITEGAFAQLIDEMTKGYTLDIKLDADVLCSGTLTDKKNDNGIAFIIPISLGNWRKLTLSSFELSLRLKRLLK